MIVHFLIDAMRGRIDGAKTSHRIDAARLLLKLGSDDAPAFIADFSSHTRPGGGSAYSSGAIVGRHNRKYVTRLAKFVRTKTGDGKDLVNFLVDAMLGRPEDFKPAARLAAAKELLRLGWETVPTVGRNRKARRSEAAPNGLLIDSRKAAPNGPKANGARTNGPKAAHNGARTSGSKPASNGAKAGGRKAAANGTKNLPGDRAHSSKIRQHQPTAAKAAAKDTDEPLTDRDDDSRQSNAPQHDAPQQSNNPQHDDEEAPWYDRPTPPVITVEDYDAGRKAQQDAEPEQPYEREAMRKGIDLWRDPAEYWIAADEDPTAYRPSQRMDSTYFPRGP